MQGAILIPPFRFFRFRGESWCDAFGLLLHDSQLYIDYASAASATGCCRLSTSNCCRLSTGWRNLNHISTGSRCCRERWTWSYCRLCGLDPSMGTGLPRRFEQGRARFCKWKQGHCIRPCTGWRSAPGFDPNGRARRIISGRSTTSSPRPAGNNSLPNITDGLVIRPQLRA